MFRRNMWIFAAVVGVSLTLASSLMAQEGGFQMTYQKPKDPATWAGDLPGYKVGDYAKKETVTILGKPYELVFIQMPETNLTWDDVRALVPDVVAKKPDVETTDLDALKYLDKLLLTTSHNYEVLALKSFKENRDRYFAENPNLPEDIVKRAVFEKYHVNQGDVKEVQDAHNTYLATMYLAEAMRFKLGYVAKKGTH